MDAANSPNGHFVRWALELVRQCRLMNMGEAEFDPRLNNAFVGLCNLLLDFELEEREAFSLVPTLLETCMEVYGETMVLPRWIVDACIRQLSEEWLLETVEQGHPGWGCAFVCEVTVVASGSIIDALVSADFKALADFGGDILLSLNQAGVDLQALYVQSIGLDPETKFDLAFLVNPHPIDCSCTVCQFRMGVEGLLEEHLSPETYLARLVMLVIRFADTANNDDALMRLVFDELNQALSFFLKTNIRDGFVISDQLLVASERLFRSWNTWPDVVVQFLVRFPPSMSLETWARRSGWVYKGQEQVRIVSRETAEAERALNGASEPADLTLDLKALLQLADDEEDVPHP